MKTEEKDEVVEPVEVRRARLKAKKPYCPCGAKAVAWNEAGQPSCARCTLSRMKSGGEES